MCLLKIFLTSWRERTGGGSDRRDGRRTIGTGRRNVLGMQMGTTDMAVMTKCLRQRIAIPASGLFDLPFIF